MAATPPPVRGGKQPKILFATQATARPPTFVLFTSGFLEAGYRRFLERKLREKFGFEGSPIKINVRVREKRGSLRREEALSPTLCSNAVRDTRRERSGRWLNWPSVPRPRARTRSSRSGRRGA